MNNRIAPRVFISYARSDGEEFAHRLRKRLEQENIPLWQDRVGMEGGRDWWQQITEALDQVEFMVLVMTPNALASDTVRKEWRYAGNRESASIRLFTTQILIFPLCAIIQACLLTNQMVLPLPNSNSLFCPAG